MGTRQHGRDAQVKFETFLEAQEKRETEAFLRDAPGILAEIAAFIKAMPAEVTSIPNWSDKTLPMLRTGYADVKDALKAGNKALGLRKFADLISLLNSWQLRSGVSLVLRREMDSRYSGPAAIAKRYYLDREAIPENLLKKGPVGATVEETPDGIDVRCKITGRKVPALAAEREYLIRFNPCAYGTHRTGYEEAPGGMVTMFLVRYASTGD